MQGTMIVIEPNGAYAAKALTEPPELDTIYKALGGSPELVTSFDTIQWSGEVLPCAVFCDEEGKLKEKPVNQTATALWDHALGRTSDETLGRIPGDVLVGPVVVILGDEELMQEL
jgi:hypothetical protein